VFAASTGVIGEQLPAEKITGQISDVWPRLAEADTETWTLAANAIMTTDTFAKGAGRSLQIGGFDINIAGIAKGSGMIAPDMATMLAFIFTDAAISAPVLQELLSHAIDKSFNAITVDSDTSTSDTVLLMATGAVDGQPEVTSIDAPEMVTFTLALQEVLIDLAKQIVCDGEGATKFITVTVEGAENNLAARRIGLAIANSPLVKTAVSGEDANWGRIVMAVGKSGEMVDRDTLSIKIGGHAVALNGVAVEDYDEAPIALHMKNDEIDIFVDIGLSDGRSTVWTCDLSHDYISINADYRS
jgi:glutamate N-acetyltransferase/amino-acid N-acetyltransferase